MHIFINLYNCFGIYFSFKRINEHKLKHKVVVNTKNIHTNLQFSFKKYECHPTIVLFLPLSRTSSNFLIISDAPCKLCLQYAFNIASNI